MLLSPLPVTAMLKSVEPAGIMAVEVAVPPVVAKTSPLVAFLVTLLKVQPV